jgi:aminodeoxyfutalosine deaminase
MSTWSLTARWIFPVDGPPLANGVVVIADDKIAAIEAPGTLTSDIDLGNVAVIPGLVNAHTHLDLTGLRGKCPPTPDFTQWLRGVIAHRRGQTAEDIQRDINVGIEESVAMGTTLVGDITPGGASWSALAHTQLRSVVFYEMLGVLMDRVIDITRLASDWLKSHRSTIICRPGLSPHAPYSTHRLLYDWAAESAFALRIPLATHLAETQAEVELLAEGTGAFLPFLMELSAWNPAALFRKPSEIVRSCGILRGEAPSLFVHCNYLSSTRGIEDEATIIYCPRTHAAFGHPPHPFREFLQRGVRVALGTDSLASNPDLSIIGEMRFIHQRYPEFPGDALLRMGTLSGAEALGWADETGSLTPGKSADLATVPLADDEGEPHLLLLRSEKPVSRTLFRGQWS